MPLPIRSRRLLFAALLCLGLAVAALLYWLAGAARNAPWAPG